MMKKHKGLTRVTFKWIRTLTISKINKKRVNLILLNFKERYSYLIKNFIRFKIQEDKKK